MTKTGSRSITRRTTDERFWAKVERRGPSECWLWTASKMWDGYGQFHLNGRKRKAHQVAFELSGGRRGPGVEVRHTCDERACCNPAHLLPGSRRDNARDAVERGRTARGERHGRSKLTAADVAELRAWRAVGGWTVYDLGEAFGVSFSHAARVCRGGNWADAA